MYFVRYFKTLFVPVICFHLKHVVYKLNYKLQRRSDQHLEEQKELLELLQEEGAIRAKDVSI